MKTYQGPLQNLTAVFASHRVAANLLMVLMILAGIWGIKKLNTQFFPNFELDIITIQVTWSGAAAEDIERSIILPIEEELKSLPDIDTYYSTANQSIASIRLEVKEDADSDFLLDEVKQKIDSIEQDLPGDAERPLVQKIIRYENVASLLVSGDNVTLDELRPMVRDFEHQLLQVGLSKIEFTGLPDQEIAIQVPSHQLHELDMTLNNVATSIQQRSIDLPAGTAAKGDGSRQIRSLSQQRDVEGFRQLPLFTDESGRLIRLGDVADIDLRPKDKQIELFYQGSPAVLVRVRRTENEDTLKTAKVLNDWLEKTQPLLPPNIKIIAFDERWQPVKERINLLLKNGLGGLALVICILFLFLNARVAAWVTVGIPISFLATLAVLYVIGGSINMISLFGLIMALGIIVDDAIVVGEDTLTHLKMGEPGLQASIGGAHRMLAPVMASSMTTIAAFLPLLLLEGRIGNILIDIPTIIICVIVASLIECFLILPGHLHHSLHKASDLHPSKLRLKLDAGFEHFRDKIFRPIVTWALEFRWATIFGAFAIFLVAIALVAGGRIKFNFFPAVERESITANVQFAAGTDRASVSGFLNHLDTTLWETDAELDENVVKVAFIQERQADFSRTSVNSFKGDEFGALKIEVYSADSRVTTNKQLIAAWRERIQLPPGIEKFSIDQARSGPSGKPIEVKLTGPNMDNLKAASLELQDVLKSYNGLSNVDDDLPFGKSQLIYELTPAGKAAGLTLQAVGRQLRASFDGIEVQSFYTGQEEVEVRVVLPNAERDRLRAVEQLPIILPNGGTTLLANVVQFRAKQGLDTLQRVDGQLALNVTADLDEAAANANEIIASLKAKELDTITSRYGIQASFEGANKRERRTMADMQMGVFLALTLIFIILAWVFASYTWPIAIMLAIPLGLTGAILGHGLLGIDLTILSLFGFFGLSGIVINDSIVLITFYKKLRSDGMEVREAVIEAACQRLRAVLLTSLTTIAGLTPILFETSLQAQFLIPMAVSIVFGLAYGTVLILLFVPSMLTVIEGGRAMLGRKPEVSLNLDQQT
ncbi:efflux RND transporter permease subunit [Pontibacterium sp. N1Y112]|uniref:Efflux RND transporter permease subunit n=1 Tax=Pontibacterium sinense TaxID=2781979 RepID=A0A8J7FBZ0_9GAMM|nr:efflux RND transporter permease subunit [Pontibacterium sinense]MBE9398740.1 efflux RND transporter permease subunit [Pontibacterium sinense]